MKEVKRFFEHNRLNKGYSRSNNHIQTDQALFRKKYEHILPPIDILAEYEELTPGITEKLLDMAKREQNHRHSLELVVIERQNRSLKNSRLFFLIFVFLICFTAPILALFADITTVNIFLISAFASLAVTAVFVTNSSPDKRSKDEKPSRHKHIQNIRHNKKHENTIEPEASEQPAPEIVEEAAIVDAKPASIIHGKRTGIKKRIRYKPK